MTEQRKIYSDNLRHLSLDRKPNLSICDCEPTPWYNADGTIDEEEGEATHYLRECQNCGFVWHSLHCPHDGCQRKCGECGTRAQQVEETEPDEPFDKEVFAAENEAVWQRSVREPSQPFVVSSEHIFPSIRTEEDRAMLQLVNQWVLDGAPIDPATVALVLPLPKVKRRRASP
jgi:hypothetical protein